MSPARGAYRTLVSYSQVHLRLKVDRGRASQHLCTACGSAAHHWAYTGGAPDELTDDLGRKYSADQSYYQPMCRPCHGRLDHAIADGRDVGVCPKGHPWTPENTGIRVKRSPTTGLRFCRACNRESARRWRQKNRRK